jgi:hypothetical protein
MVIGQWIFSIPRRQEFTNVFTFLMVVFFVLHVSAPYNNIDLTLELSRRILVRVDMRWDHQMFFKALYKDVLAFPVQVFTSASVPPCWFITICINVLYFLFLQLVMI